MNDDLKDYNIDVKRRVLSTVEDALIFVMN
jgi:hypothetical protein